MITLENAITEFLIASEADGLADATLRWYQSLLKHLRLRYGQLPLDEINTRHLRVHIIGIRAKYKDDTSSAHIRSLHRFFRWCADEYQISNPMRNVKYPRVAAQQQPKAINQQDLVKLFAATGDGEIGVRDRAILAVLADTGCRVGGLVGLHVVDVDLDQRIAFVKEKGDKSRALHFTDFTARLISEWITVGQPEDYLFINIKRRTGLTVTGVQQMLKRLKARGNISGRVNPHSFRHAFGRQYLISGGNLAMLSKLMGHADVKTTAAFYAVFESDELGDSHEKHSPMRKILDKDAGRD